MPISRPRSGAEIAGIPCGSSEKQIFGNCVLPENRANQILARLLLESRFLLLHESPVGGLQILLGIVFRPHSPFRQSDQGTAHRKMALFATRRTALASVAGMVTLWRIALDVAERGGVLVLLGILPCETILHLCGADWVKCGVGRRTQRVPRLPHVGQALSSVNPFASEQQFGERVQRCGKRNMHHLFLPADPD